MFEQMELDILIPNGISTSFNEDFTTKQLYRKSEPIKNLISMLCLALKEKTGA